MEPGSSTMSTEKEYSGIMGPRLWLEKVLRYGYVYHADPDRPDELAYYIRKTEPYESVHESDGSVYEMLPPMDKWPRIAAGDLEVEEMDGMTLELDFGGTTSREVWALLV